MTLNSPILWGFEFVSPDSSSFPPFELVVSNFSLTKFRKNTEAYTSTAPTLVNATQEDRKEFPVKIISHAIRSQETVEIIYYF